MPNTADDLSLFAKIQQNDETALEEIFHRYWSKLFTVARQVLENEALCKDLVQDIFVDLWNRRQHLQIGNLNAYLYQAMRYQVAKQLRKRPISALHLEVLEDLRSHLSTQEPWMVAEFQEQIEEIIGGLPPRCQEIFRLSRFEQLSNKEIAAQLGLSLRTVENQIHIALRVLRANEDLALSFVLLSSWLFASSDELLMMMAG